MTPLRSPQDVPPASMLDRLCQAWLLAVFVLFFLFLADVDNVMVQDGQLDRLMFWTRISAGVTVVCAIQFVRRRHKVSKQRHIGKVIGAYALMVSLSVLMGGAVVYKGLPRASLLWHSTQMSVTDTLYKVSLDRNVNRTVRRRYLSRLGDRIFEHPNNEIYDLYLDHYFDPYLRRQQVSVSNRRGQTLSPNARGGPANPKTVLLHGVGNSFAMRVFDFTVINDT